MITDRQQHLIDGSAMRYRVEYGMHEDAARHRAEREFEANRAYANNHDNIKQFNRVQAARRHILGM